MLVTLRSQRFNKCFFFNLFRVIFYIFFIHFFKLFNPYWGQWILRILKERLWALQSMGVMLKTKTKEITTVNWNKDNIAWSQWYFKATTDCLGAEIDGTCKWFRGQRRFFCEKKKLRAREKSPFYVKSEICVLTLYWGWALKKVISKTKLYENLQQVFLSF